jgi:hypothetical protein
MKRYEKLVYFFGVAIKRIRYGLSEAEFQHTELPFEWIRQAFQLQLCCWGCFACEINF